MSLVYPPEPFYVVDGLGLNYGAGWGKCGFSIGLDPKFAKKFYESELKDRSFEVLNEEGKRLVTSFFEHDINPRNPYNFVRNEEEKNTLLLRYCVTFGNACDLGIDGMKIDNILKWDDYTMNTLVEYGPHNVDSRMQSFSLFALWSHWANTAYALTSNTD